MSRRLALLVTVLALAAAASSESASAGVWKRTRADGTIEFTNVPKGGSRWRTVKEVPRQAPARDEIPRVTPAAGPLAAPSTPRSPGSTVWSRENDDGTVEFTNVSPTGARWKVLFRTGPGKAAALRGSSDLVPPRDASVGRVARYDQHIRDQQSFFGVPEALVRAVIKTESDYDPHVVSSAGAIGLMQLMPGTARMMGVSDIWDPRQNIMGGSRYLQVLAKRFCRTPIGNDGVGNGFYCSAEERIKIIAGYHAGPGAVEKYGGMPPYETTRAYVTTVLARYEQYRRQDAYGSIPGARVASR